MDRLLTKGEAEFNAGHGREGPGLASRWRAPLELGRARRRRRPRARQPPEPKTARLVVFGDSDFASNQLIGEFRNRDLFVNSVNWLLGDVEAISVRPGQARASRLQLSSEQFLEIRYLALFVMPELIARARRDRLVAAPPRAGPVRPAHEPAQHRAAGARGRCASAPSSGSTRSRAGPSARSRKRPASACSPASRPSRSRASSCAPRTARTPAWSAPTTKAGSWSRRSRRRPTASPPTAWPRRSPSSRPRRPSTRRSRSRTTASRASPPCASAPATRTTRCASATRRRWAATSTPPTPTGKKVFALASWRKNALEKSVKQLRDGRVLDFDRAQVKGITLAERRRARGAGARRGRLAHRGADRREGRRRRGRGPALRPPVPARGRVRGRARRATPSWASTRPGSAPS